MGTLSTLLGRLLVLGGTLAGGLNLSAAEITIAAASNVKFAFDELVPVFQEKHPGISVRVSYGSSGNFYAQIQNKAPFDIFFSADMDYPKRLAEAGLALDASVFLYALGRIVVWAPNSSPMDVEKLGMQSLIAPPVKKIAIANPRHAPYGVAALAAMKEFNIYEQAKPRLVLGENIAQAAQFAQSGAADVGIIAMSLVLAPAMRDAGRYWEIPPESYPRVEQGAVILKTTKHREAARAFFAYIRGAEAQEVMKRYGYSLPED